MPNIERLEGTMRHIIDNPHLHDQAGWIARTSCGTVGCYAGWTALLYGPDLEWKQAADPAVFINRRSGRWMHAENLAIALLEIDGDDASWLFDAYNTIDDLQVKVKHLVNGGHAPVEAGGLTAIAPYELTAINAVIR